ncbi:MAG: hypothetical protein JWQ70_206 [Aeromicrobium sp.]|nr:hypothetical protein [Aeromicrobium sp.]
MDQRLRRLIVPAWATALALAVCAPLFAHGYVLSYDMVWVPHLDLDRPEIWGLGSALPRAVPSDAVVALLGAILPAAVVQRIVLFAALFLLAVGMARLLRERPLVAQLAGATLAVWNPLVAERLVLGQWPLLLALAGFPWLIFALADKDGPHWWLAVLALAATALSPATGLMGVVLGGVAAWRRGVVRVVILAALLNGPWIIAGLRHASEAKSDPRAVGLFDLQSEGHFGKLGSALTLGGIWNTEVVPTSRTLVIAVVIAALLAVVMLIGVAVMWHEARRLLAVTGVAGVLGLGVALAGWLAPDRVSWIVANVSGGGVVRDGTRWLALLVPLEAVAFAAGVSSLLDRRAYAHRLVPTWVAPAAVLAALLPLVAMPDLAWGVGGKLEPTSYPSSWADARKVIESSKTPGDILVLPFTAYRRPAWNHDTSVLDPAGRYFNRVTVTNDELEVSGHAIAGEDPRAKQIRTILDGSDVRSRLARQGIGIVVVETDAPGATKALREVKGARELVGGEGMRVFALPGATATSTDIHDRRAMTATWVVAGLTLLLGLIGGMRSALRRLDRKPAKHPTRQVSKP